MYNYTNVTGDSVDLLRCVLGRVRMIAHLQSRINHCVGCTVGGGRSRQGAPDQQLPNFYHAVLTFQRTFRNHKIRGLKYVTTEKGRQLLEEGKKCVPPEKILATCKRKRPHLKLVWAPNG